MPRTEVPLNRLPVDQPVRVEAEDMGIVVIRTASGITAYEDVCPHAQWRLSGGEVINGRLECPGHGWEFDVSTGGCVTVPAYCLRPVRVDVLENGMVALAWEKARAPVETTDATTNS
jgi:nitrite reductase/ring-hydroxylating ferredoxin subunit